MLLPSEYNELPDKYKALVRDLDVLLQWAELETEVASVGVKGSPPCNVRIPLTCHPPKIAFPTEFEISKCRPLPKGKS